jgi:hypothetical protein
MDRYENREYIEWFIEDHASRGRMIWFRAQSLPPPPPPPPPPRTCGGGGPATPVSKFDWRLTGSLRKEVTLAAEKGGTGGGRGADRKKAFLVLYKSINTLCKQL